MLLLLLACGPADDLVLLPEAAPLSAARADALAADWVAEEHTRLVAAPRVTLPGGAPVVPDPTLFLPLELPVVEPAGEIFGSIAGEADGDGSDGGLVVLARGGPARLLLRVDAEALDLVLYDDTWVGADPSPQAAGAPGVLLRAGVAPRLERGRALVDLDGPLAGTLAVPSGALEDRWLVDARRSAATFGDVDLAPGTLLYDDAGRALATVTGDDSLGAVRLDGPEEAPVDGRVRVEVRSAHASTWSVARGWVDATAARPVGWGSSWGTSSCGCRGWFAGGGPDVVLVPAGTPLLEGPGGAPVGVLDAPLPAPVDAPEDGFATELWTALGAATVWVPPTEAWGALDDGG